MSGSTRVALLACSSPGEPAGRWLNYAARRLMAELTEPALPGVEARLFEMDPERPDEATEAVAEFAPDLLGCSAYLWSFAPLLEAAAEVERRHPDTTVVFGGPSARAAMFELEPHRGAASCVDALVVGEGERTFRAMAASKSRDLASFATLPGVAVRTPNGFSEPRFAGVADVDSLVSPYRAGWIEPSEIAMLESFRGCPLDCLFCQWGSAAAKPTVFSAETIARDLRDIAGLGPQEVLLLDSAINLDARAFRNLAEAERATGVLANIPLSFELHPARLTDEHVAFLSSIELGNIGVGVQSHDLHVLRQLRRRLDVERSEDVVRTLAALGADVCVELILGLPWDSPDGFLRTLDRVLELGCKVHVFHCLALPDALMTRAPAGAEIQFDPDTLLVTSCAGWSAADLERMSAHLDASTGARPNEHFSTWRFEGKTRRGRSRGPRSLSPEARASFGARVQELGLDRWRVGKIELGRDFVLVELGLDAERIAVEIRPSSPAARPLLRVGNVDLSYRGTPSEAAIRALTQDAPALAGALAGLLAELAG